MHRSALILSFIITLFLTLTMMFVELRGNNDYCAVIAYELDTLSSDKDNYIRHSDGVYELYDPNKHSSAETFYKKEPHSEYDFPEANWKSQLGICKLIWEQIAFSFFVFFISIGFWTFLLVMPLVFLIGGTCKTLYGYLKK